MAGLVDRSGIAGRSPIPRLPTPGVISGLLSLLDGLLDRSKDGTLGYTVGPLRAVLEPAAAGWDGDEKSDARSSYDGGGADKSSSTGAFASCKDQIACDIIPDALWVNTLRYLLISYTQKYRCIMKRAYKNIIKNLLYINKLTYFI